MPPSLEKPKRKKKDQKQKQKQKQEQTVIVNINKQKRVAPRNNGIKRPKEKEQPKTFNSFSFSSPQAQNPIGEYLKLYSKDLFSKIEQSIKSRDPVINSVNESLNPIIAVKSPERKPTVLETIKPPTTLDNFIKTQEDLATPLVIGEPTVLPDVTTLDEPSISLDEELIEPAPEVPPEEISKDTVESLKKVEESPNLFELLSKSVKPSIEQAKMGAEDKQSAPIQLGAEPKKRGRPPLSAEVKAEREILKAETKNPVGRPPLSAEEKAEREILKKAEFKRPVGRPIGTTNELRARLNNFVEPENHTSVLSIPRQQSSDLTIPSRVQRRKQENPFTSISEAKSPPLRRASINIGTRLGSTL